MRLTAYIIIYAVWGGP